VQESCSFRHLAHRPFRLSQLVSQRRMPHQSKSRHPLQSMQKPAPKPTLKTHRVQQPLLVLCFILPLPRHHHSPSPHHHHPPSPPHTHSLCRHSFNYLPSGASSLGFLLLLFSSSSWSSSSSSFHFSNYLSRRLVTCLLFSSLRLRLRLLLPFSPFPSQSVGAADW
jgi:hypothetical protein